MTTTATDQPDAPAPLRDPMLDTIREALRLRDLSRLKCAPDLAAYLEKIDQELFEFRQLRVAQVPQARSAE